MAPLTRRALQLTALYGVGWLVLATAAFLTQAHTWMSFSWFQWTEIIFLFYVPLTAILWLIYATFRLAGKAQALLSFTVIGFALPFICYAALLVPSYLGQIVFSTHR